MSEKLGRPSKLTEEILEEICEITSESTKGLAILCDENPHWPRPRTLRKCIRNNEDFRHKYALAKEDQAHLLAEEIITIADDKSNDVLMKQNKDGSEHEVCNAEFIARSRLRVDTRKWLAGKLFPKIYGDKFLENKNDFSSDDDIAKDKELVQKCMKSIP